MWYKISKYVRLIFQCPLDPRSDSTCHTDHTLTVSRNALNHPIARYGGPPICLPIPSHYAWHATTQCLQPGVQPGSVCGSNPLNMLTSPLSFSFSSKWLVLESSFMLHYPTQFRYAFFFLSFFFSFTYLLIWCSHNLHHCTCLLCNCIHNVSSMLLNAYNLLGSVCIEKRGTLGGTCLDVKCKCITSEAMPIFIMWLSMMWSTEE